MKIPVYWGCKILASEYIYEISLRAVAKKLGVQLIDIEDAACCGMPIRNISSLAATYMAARILELATRTGMHEMLLPCSLCHFSLTEALYKLQSEPGVKEKIMNLLAEEKLDLSPKLKLWHTVDFLYDRLGLETIEKQVNRPFKEVKLAVHPGCYLIRPSKLGRIDEAENPRKLDELTKALGIKIVDYPQKLECCGGLSLQSTTALAMAGDKLKSVQASGADGLVCACPHCFEMLDSKQGDIATSTGTKLEIPVIYYTQLLGLALGLGEEELGLNLNRSPIDKLFAFA